MCRLWTTRERSRVCGQLGGVLASIIFGAGAALAGGAWVYENGSTDVGTASAGRAAIADDASTSFGNPAGMTRLQSQVLIGLQPLVVTTEFDVGGRTTVDGSDGGNAGGFIPAGGIYGVYSLRDDLKLGIAVNSYANGELDYDSDWGAATSSPRRSCSP